MSTDSTETKSAATPPEAIAKTAPTEQQSSQPGTPKKFALGQTVCNQKTEKGKLCNGHLKQIQTAHDATVYLRGDDVLHGCQTCGTLYMGPPMGHVRDPKKQQRYVEKELAAILQAAGGTLPAYDYPVPAWRGAPPVKPRAAENLSTSSVEKPSASTVAPEGETAERKKARLLAEHKARLAAGGETKPASSPTETASTADSSSADSTTAAKPVVGSSAQADRHRPAAEAQAATGQASAAPLSPAAATASPAAGAETPADLAAEASTELTPGAPVDERPASDAAQAAAQTEATPNTEAAPKPKKVPPPRKSPPAPVQAAPPGETQEEKIARLKRVVEDAKRRAGKLD